MRLGGSFIDPGTPRNKTLLRKGLPRETGPVVAGLRRAPQLTLGEGTHAGYPISVPETLFFPNCGPMIPSSRHTRRRPRSHR